MLPKPYWPARVSKRYVVSLGVVCPDGTPLSAVRVINISSSGACIVVPRVVAAGGHHDFHIGIPDARHGLVAVAVSGMVAWSRDTQIGIRFVGRYARIEDYVDWLERVAEPR